MKKVKVFLSGNIFDEIIQHCFSKKKQRKAYGFLSGTKLEENGEISIFIENIHPLHSDISSEPSERNRLKELFEKYGYPSCSCDRNKLGFIVHKDEVEQVENEIKNHSNKEILCFYHLHACKFNNAQFPSKVDIETHIEGLGDDVVSIIVYMPDFKFQSIKAFKIKSGLQYEECELLIKHTSMYNYPEFAPEYYDNVLTIPQDKLNNVIAWHVNKINTLDRSGKELLFIGIGTGRIEIPIINKILTTYQNVDVDIKAIEPSWKMLEIFKDKLRSNNFVEENRKWKKERITIEIIEKKFEKVDFNENRFDAVFSFFVVNHFSDFREGIQKIRLILKEGGKLFISEEIGGMRWIDNNFKIAGEDIQRIKEYEDEKFYYDFWREYHQLREEIGKVWAPEISPTDISQIVNDLETEEMVIKWGKKSNVKDLLSWIRGEKIIFTPLIHNLNEEELKYIGNKMGTIWGIRLNREIKHIESNKYYSISFTRQDKTNECKNIDIPVPPKSINIHRHSEKDIYLNTSNRLIRLYSKIFYKYPKCGLVNISFDSIKDTWFRPFPILLSGIKQSEYAEVIISNALYYYLISYLTNLSLTDYIFKDSPLLYQYIVRSRDANNVFPSFYQKSGKLKAIHIEFNENIIKSRVENIKSGLKGMLDHIKPLILKILNSKRPAVSPFHILNYNYFYEINTLLEDEEKQNKTLQGNINKIKTTLETIYTCNDLRALSKNFYDTLQDIKPLFPIVSTSPSTKEINNFIFQCIKAFLIGINTEDHTLKEMVYFPVTGITENNVEQGYSGLIFMNFCDDAIEKRERDIIQLNIDIDGYLDFTREKERQLIYKSIQSAIVAIMSRNMSHNIGSHVLARVSSKGINGWTESENTDDIVKGLQYENKAKEVVNWCRDVQILSQYLQQRQDFIAQIATEWPEWTYPTWLMKDLMRWFLSQKHLLNYIGASENLRAYFYDNPPQIEGNKYPIRFHVFKSCKEIWDRKIWNNGNSIDLGVKIWKEKIEKYCTREQCSTQECDCTIKANSNCTTGDGSKLILLYTSKDNKVCCCLDEDIQIAVPGGIIGYHAFYTVLENVIRNGAKHSFTRMKEWHEKNNATISDDITQKLALAFGTENDIHFDVIIEILDEENILPDGHKDKNSYRFRIYDNVSFVRDDDINKSEECLLFPKIDADKNTDERYDPLKQNDYNELKELYEMINALKDKDKDEISFSKIFETKSKDKNKCSSEEKQLLEKFDRLQLKLKNLKRNGIQKNIDNEEQLKSLYETVYALYNHLAVRMNEYFRQDIITESGELKKGNWGLGEMKISAGYLQKKEIMQIGMGKDRITDDPVHLSSKPDEKDEGFIIRATVSPLGTLTYEFRISKPKEVGIVCRK